MPDHFIRLRRAWDAKVDGQSLRVDLPATWTSAVVPLELSRRFQRPRLGNPDEAIYLRFEDVPGLVSVFLNGVRIGPTQNPGDWEVAIPQPTLSNQLLLILDPTLVAEVDGWGKIALVIRS